MALGLLSSGLSLLGGILGRRSADRARRRQEYLNSPAGIRAESESAGFNPLVFAGQAGSFGAGNMVTGGQIMAQALTDAASAIPRQQELEIANAQLQIERDRLTEQVRQATLQPNVPGIYGDEPRQESTINPNAPPVTGTDGVDRADPYATGIYDRRYGPLRLLANPNQTGAEETQQRYGDIGEEIGGLAALTSDLGYTIGRNIADRRMEAYFRDVYENVYPGRFPTNRAIDVYAPYQFSRRQSMIENPLRRFQ